MGRKVAVVLGYGCHLSEELRDYLHMVGTEVRDEHDITQVVFCGGETNRLSASGVTEAQVMRDHLHSQMYWRKVVSDYGLLLELEDNSITTAQNLRNAQRILDRHKPQPTKIIIFADKARALKVRWLAKCIFRGVEVRIVTYALTRSPLGYLKQWLVAPLEVLTLWWPWLERKKLELAKRKIARM